MPTGAGRQCLQGGEQADILPLSVGRVFERTGSLPFVFETYCPLCLSFTAFICNRNPEQYSSPHSQALKYCMLKKQLMLALKPGRKQELEAKSKVEIPCSKSALLWEIVVIE